MCRLQEQIRRGPELQISAANFNRAKYRRYSTGYNKASVCVCVCVSAAVRARANPPGPEKMPRAAPLVTTAAQAPSVAAADEPTRKRSACSLALKCPPGAGTLELFGAAGRGPAQGFGGDPHPSLPHTHKKNIPAKPEVLPISAIS